MGKREGKRFYGKMGRFALWSARTFSKKYECGVSYSEEPAIYVCRHLNMHGPYTTLKWLRFDVHPLVLHSFCDKKECYRQLTEYTFSVKKNKKPKKYSLKAYVASRAISKTVRSLQAVPVYRGSAGGLKTFRKSMDCLMKGESLIVYPDIDYTAGRERSGEIYKGFLYLGERYYKKTGKQLKFVPVYIDEEEKRLREGAPVVVNNYKKDGQSGAATLRSAINGELGSAGNM